MKKPQKIAGVNLSDKSILVLGKSGVFVPHVGSGELLIFTENLGAMMEAGIPIAESLELVYDLTDNKHLKDIIYISRRQVEAGKPLHSSLSFFPNVFDPIFLNVVKSGEISGTLSSALEYLAQEIEAKNDLQQKIISIMIYPALISTVLLGVVIFMLIFVIPKMKDLYDQVGQELPFLTRMVLGLSELATSIWAVVILIIFGILIVGFIIFSKSGFGKRKIHKFVLSVPYVSDLTKQTILQRISRTFSLTLKSGVPIIEALAIVGETTGNVIYGEGVIKLSKALERGQSISMTIMNDKTLYPKLFVPLFVRIIAVGERTGNLPDSLGKLSTIYYKKVSKQIRTLSALIEPVLLVLIGIIVGVLTLAVTLPIYNLPNTIGMG